MLEIPYASYLAMLRRFVEQVTVDEVWYRAAYPGVAQAIDGGLFGSAARHFLVCGYFEGRLPYDPDQMPPPPPFEELRAVIPLRLSRSGPCVRASRVLLMRTIQRLLEAVAVDEAWYRQTYSGVAKAIADGTFTSSAQHFVLHGYAELRWPFPMSVDEAWYLARYPDVPFCIADGHARSAQDHFWNIGYREGRLPTRVPVDITARQAGG